MPRALLERRLGLESKLKFPPGSLRRSHCAAPDHRHLQDQDLARDPQAEAGFFWSPGLAVIVGDGGGRGQC